MSTTSTSTTTAGPTRRATASGLTALTLGILAVPGSTLAWDLPVGGLWIGLPLGIAAIVVGRRARREGDHPRAAMTGIVIAALCILQMAVWTLVAVVS